MVFDYVFAKGEGNKGASYKRTWKPDWRSPPGIKGSRIALQVLGLCALCALPVVFVSSREGAREKQPDVYMIQKQKAREERMRWIESDDMPPK
ncbi:hypothetical protein HYH03_009306 [Edaphochlamys debaryana]|uniref:Uncharacterized protein n=1 Tax=Edaphochlamys debaryana TaxID=47281 RepID=A0A836BYI8_9CHLO|nr:hypothetical protein HYH03_009306 [Edaphochlamys debaryana]|eukprot:KAG2492358.1 hypothetical protein HYH03_009306 [Edaphochlamys debaryana]